MEKNRDSNGEGRQEDFEQQPRHAARAMAKEKVLERVESFKGDLE